MDLIVYAVLKHNWRIWSTIQESDIFIFDKSDNPITIQQWFIQSWLVQSNKDFKNRIDWLYVNWYKYNEFISTEWDKIDEWVFILSVWKNPTTFKVDEEKDYKMFYYVK